MECSIADCERPVVARGWCGAHWRRFSRTGDPLGSKPHRRTIGADVMDAVLERYAVGELAGALAVEYGIAKSTIHRAVARAEMRRESSPFTVSRRDNIAAGLRLWNSGRPDRSHPADCQHCSAIRGRPKPARAKSHGDAISTSRRRLSEPSYTTMHGARLRRDRGQPTAQTCRCGARAREWALSDQVPAEFLRREPEGRLFSIRTVDYDAMCIPCHRAEDARRRREAA